MEAAIQPDAPHPAVPGAVATTPREVTIHVEPVHLSLVIPAYNEEARLGATLEAVIAFLAPQPYRSEAVVVLDGCTDGTLAVVRAHEGPHGNLLIRFLDNPVNRGKGACVRQGMLAAGGRYRVFTDADLSYPLHQLAPFLAHLEDRGGVVVASRQASAVRYQAPARRLVTALVRTVMHHGFVPGIADTQAGFKGFTAEVAEDLFGVQRLGGFGFDVEILHIAHMRGYPIAPLAVEWRDVPGTRVRLVRDVVRGALELLALVGNRLAGRYARREAAVELVATVPAVDASVPGVEASPSAAPARAE